MSEEKAPDVADTGILWPGAAPTLDGVMAELRRTGERLSYFSSLIRYDARVYQELAAANAKIAELSRPAARSQREKAPWQLRAEAYLLFGEYCEREATRLNEKRRQLEAGSLDTATDSDWRLRNEEIADRAVARETSAADAWSAMAAAPRDLFGEPTQ